MCRMHQGRVDRHGDPHFTHYTHRDAVSSHGYVWTHAPLHPLAHGRSRVYRHRMVLFDAIGAGPHSCNWCGTTVWWEPEDGQKMLEADHVDADRLNNDRSNLVPSCQACNKSRREHYKLQRTHCPNGHLYTAENQVNGYPHRKCLMCRRERQRRFEQRQR
jgi:hypothetical protein